jgi:hypothetical protein
MLRFAMVTGKTRLTSIVILAACVLVLTRVFAPASAPAAPGPVSSAALRAFDQSVPVLSEVNAEVERLRQRLANPPTPPAITRDPFRFGARITAPAKPAPVVPPPPALVIAPPAAAIVLPRLVAITSDATDGGLVRRALISIGDDVLVLTPGSAAGKFLVRSVGTDSAELVDPATGLTYRIR